VRHDRTFDNGRKAVTGPISPLRLSYAFQTELSTVFHAATWAGWVLSTSAQWVLTTLAQLHQTGLTVMMWGD